MRLRYHALILCAVMIFAAGSSTAQAFPMHWLVGLTGHEVVPATPSTATGYAHLYFNDAHDSMTYWVHLRGFTSNRTAVTFHNAQPWVNGPLVFTLMGPTGSADVDLYGRVYWPPDVQPLVAEDCYYIYMEVDTEQYPDGELRGYFEPADGTVAVRATTWGQVRKLYR